MIKIPVTIAKYLSIQDSNDFEIYDKFAYLIKSKDGDDYYLTTDLPEKSL